MDEGFFGFDTTVSLSDFRRGPRQQLGDVTIEDADYDALNDETFGGDVLDDGLDWEEDHEKLAELLVEKVKELKENGQVPQSAIAGNGFQRPDPSKDNNEDYLEASLSQLVLDDEDTAIHHRPIPIMNRAPPSRIFSGSPPPAFLEHNAVGSPSTSSIWALPRDARKAASPAVSSPSSLSRQAPPSPTQFPLRSPFPRNVSAIKTLEELEREILHQSQPAPPPTMNRGVTLEELERTLLNSRHPQLPRAATSLEELEAEILKQSPSPRPPFQMGMPPPPPGMGVFPRLPPSPSAPPILRPLVRPGPLDSPIMMAPPPQPMLPPPMLPNGLRMLPSGPHFAHRLPMGGPMPMTLLPPPRLAMPPIPPSSHGCYDEDYDDYYGLMSNREKQWLINIQMMQLVSDNPYVDDYYYTVFRLRRTAMTASASPSARLILPSDRASKAEPKTYAPTQFANSLGKLQVVTVAAPRRIIDVHVANSTSPNGANGEKGEEVVQSPKDLKKQKQVLLEIEKMYVLLLELEDVDKRVPSISTSECEARESLEQRLVSILSPATRILAFLQVRKGKTLLLRCMPRLPPAFRDHVLRIWLANLTLLLRRDAPDQIFIALLPYLQQMLKETQQWKDFVKWVALLDSTPKVPGFNSIVANKVGCSVISLIMAKSESMDKIEDLAVREQWQRFVKSIVPAVLAASSSGMGVTTLPEVPGLTAAQFEAVELGAEVLTALRNALNRPKLQ